MLDVLKKLDNIEVKVIDILPADDREYCNALFERYQHYTRIVLGTRSYLTLTLNTAKESQYYTDDDRYGALYDINNMIGELVKSLQSLNRRLVRDIERHLKDKYHLAFKELFYDPKWDDISVFDSCQPLIDHVLQQVGTDLTAAGQAHIKEEFRGLFCKGYCEPKLQGAKISFSNLIRFQAYCFQHQISYDCKGTQSLFTALGLFLHQANEMPQELNQQFLEWQRKIEVNENYSCNGLTFKIFGNRRMDVTFESKEQARQFWDFYNLNNIRQRD